MQPNNFYHIYNRANGNENLFNEDKNYHFFLEKWNKYISPFAETYCYCLMPNHFHFLILTKSELKPLESSNSGSQPLESSNSRIQPLESSKLSKGLESKLSKGLELYEDLSSYSKLTSRSFTNLFSSYSQAFNKVYNRKGSLFMPNFKRREILTEVSLLRVIAYIHRNPVHHDIVSNLADWEYSSYNSICKKNNTNFNVDYILNLFGGISEFTDFHKNCLKEWNNNNFTLE